MKNKKALDIIRGVGFDVADTNDLRDRMDGETLYGKEINLIIEFREDTIINIEKEYTERDILFNEEDVKEELVITLENVDTIIDGLDSSLTSKMTLFEELKEEVAYSKTEDVVWTELAITKAINKLGLEPITQYKGDK